MRLSSDRVRLRFVAALVLFIVWVVSLAALAFSTGKKPPSPRERAADAREK